MSGLALYALVLLLTVSLSANLSQMMLSQPAEAAQAPSQCTDYPSLAGCTTMHAPINRIHAYVFSISEWQALALHTPDACWLSPHFFIMIIIIIIIIIIIVFTVFFPR